MSGTARGRELLKRIQRHRRAGARQNSHAAALDEQVLVQFDCVGAWGVDQERFDGRSFGFQFIEILREARPIAIEIERAFIR